MEPKAGCDRLCRCELDRRFKELEEMADEFRDLLRNFNAALNTEAPSAPVRCGVCSAAAFFDGSSDYPHDRDDGSPCPYGARFAGMPNIDKDGVGA